MTPEGAAPPGRFEGYRSSTVLAERLQSPCIILQCTLVGRLSRRRLAPLIRIRQEIDKRLDPLFPRRGPEALDRLLEPRLARLAVGSPNADDRLREALAAGSAGRFPLTHLSRRSVAELPARDVLLESIQRVANGEWSVFGTPIDVDVRDHDWLRHPMAHGPAPVGHWTRVSYMSGAGGGDVKAIWELSRHNELLRLAQGFFLERDERLATTLHGLLDRWLEQNPPAHGVNWASSLEVAFRAIAWCWIWALTCESRSWTPSRTRRFLASLWHHARHVERFDSIHHSPNTHLTGEGLGLLYVGSFFPEFVHAGRWTRRGREILESELDEQVLDDGMHYERAVGYHRYTAEFYVHYLLLARALGVAVPGPAHDRVRRQVDAARALRRPDGTWPIIGDEDSGDTLLLTPTDPHDQGPILALGGALFGDATALGLTTGAHRAAGWWLLDDAEWGRLRTVAGASVAVGRSASLETAGYFVGRDGDGADDWWCLVDAGPHGGDRTGHAHTDLGHVEIAHGSMHIVVDPGCVTYTVDRDARDRCRAESAHACLVVENEALAAPSGPFSWSRIAPSPRGFHGDADDTWWCELHYDHPGRRAPFVHRRQVVLVRGRGIVVCDWVEGVVTTPVAVHWPLGDSPRDLMLASGTLTAPRGYCLTWGIAAGEVAAAVASTTRSPRYGRSCDAALLRLELSGPTPTALVTSFAAAGQSFQFGRIGMDAIRIFPPGIVADDASTLLVRPGRPPITEHSPAHATSQRVIS